MTRVGGSRVVTWKKRQAIFVQIFLADVLSLKWKWPEMIGVGGRGFGDRNDDNGSRGMMMALEGGEDSFIRKGAL